MGKTNPLNDDDLADFIERQKTLPIQRSIGWWMWPASTPPIAALDADSVEVLATIRRLM